MAQYVENDSDFDALEGIELLPENFHTHAEPIVFYEQVVSDKLVELMIQELPKYEPSFVEAEIGDSSNPTLDLKARNSKVTWIYEDNWVSSVFSHYFNIANKGNWEYDLNCLDGIQVTKYDVNDHYTWHSDYGTSVDNRYTRKLSATLLVTDPSEYKGGDLEFIDYHNNLVVAPKKKNTMIVFDSRIPHRVTPVTEGTRISLVTWMLGPKLR
jgi:PKHD-type hydroxylase